MINGVSRLIMTKADVLNDMESIKVCVAYEVDKEQKSILPPACNLVNAKPVYKELQGWQSDIEQFDTFEQLPPALLDFISLIEEFIGITVDIISLGPDRKQTLFRKGAGILERLSKKF
jgi:adenylosuccinate synthase